MRTTSPERVDAEAPLTSNRVRSNHESRDPMSEPKIQATGVERWFDEVHALGPLDVEIEEGEFVCVVGPSGCGKSTFLRIVAGLAAPSEGDVTLSLTKSHRAPIAMVFQDYGIYPWKTVEANVRFNLDVTGTPRSEGRERARFWLDKLGLLDFAGHYPGALSGGMRQRVAIARALAVEPEILLMDEPFAALDAQLREVLQDELLAICQADRRTVLFVTHSLEEALVLGDRVIVMSARPGTVIASMPVPFERPRSPEVRNTAAFGEMRQELWNHLRAEVDETVHRTTEASRKGSRS